MWGELIDHVRAKSELERALARFGRDHKSLILYIETRCVDYEGKIEKAHLRCNPDRHPAFAHSGGWDDKYSTRWDAKVEHVVGHDDWDCVDDLVSAGLLEWLGTGTHPKFKLTDSGWVYAHSLRRQRAETKQ